ncbi:MAG: glycine oxidase ThiO [Nitrospirota bacterium]|nr:glycine oxidase ThiO [Nitrospirota bacterium]
MSDWDKSRPDVLIIGGGIIGTLTALALARDGVRVTVLERGELLRESSWAGAGILSPIYPWKYPDALSHLVNRSLALYPGLVADLEHASGVDPQRRVSGLMIPVFSVAGWERMAGAIPWSERFGWVVERLDAAAARRVEPCLSEQVVGALYWPEVAQIRNPRLARAAAGAARKAGVAFVEQAEVTGMDLSHGQVTAVHSSRGRFSSGRVLLAAGSWSGDLARNLGLDLPVSPVKGQILLIRTAPGTLTRIVKQDQAYLVPRADGRILVGATMEMAGFDRRTTLSALHFLSGALLSIAPSLADAEVERHWMGFRPGTPDGMPYLGAAPQVANLFVAAGHYRNGVVLAPATAEAMACILTGSKPPTDLSAFAVDRPQPEGRDGELGFPGPAAADARA